MINGDISSAMFDYQREGNYVIMWESPVIQWIGGKILSHGVCLLNHSQVG